MYCSSKRDFSSITRGGAEEGDNAMKDPSISGQNDYFYAKKCILIRRVAYLFFPF